MRLYCGTFYAETNTFSPLSTSEEDFAPLDLAVPGSAAFEAAMAPARALGWEVAAGFNRAALPGGIVQADVHRKFRQALLDDIKARMPLDLVVLNVHGAMAAEGCLDCEGDLLALIRPLVGPRTPIVVAMDPHAHLSAAMTANADLIACYKEYPHTDEAEIFARTVASGLRIARGELRPETSVVDLGMVNVFHTTRQPMRGIVDRMRALEQEPGIASVSLVHGFPWGDVPDLGAKVIVATNGDRALGDRVAAELAELVRQARDDTFTRPTPFEEALDRAQAAAGLTLIADTADNPGGGAAGDSTFLLASLLRRGMDAAFGPVWDPEAVAAARAAGPGAEVALRIGGKTSALSGAPVETTARVIAVSPSLVTPGVGSYSVGYGAAASVQAGSVAILLASAREQAMSPDMFEAMGVALAGRKAVVVKSSQHFHAGYAPLASEVLYADSPGALRLDLSSIPYTLARRGLWMPGSGPGEPNPPPTGAP